MHDANVITAHAALDRLIEVIRQVAYDEGYEDASSVVVVPVGGAAHEFGEQGHVGQAS